MENPISAQELIRRVLLEKVREWNAGPDACQEYRDAIYHLDQAALALNARDERVAASGQFRTAGAGADRTGGAEDHGSGTPGASAPLADLGTPGRDPKE